MKQISFVIYIILIFAVSVFVYSLSLHPQNPKLTFLDVGQGDSILIDSGLGNQMLIDSGRSKDVVENLGQNINYGDKKIEVLMASHFDADHIGGFEAIMKEYESDYLLLNGAKPTTQTANRLLEKAKENNIEIRKVYRNSIINLGNNVIIKVLYPRESSSIPTGNPGSIIAKAFVGNKTFMLTGDAPSKSELDLVNLDGNKLKSDILKLGHHGSKTSSSESFLRVVNPQLAIVSAGLNNQYGHPNKEVLDILSRLNIPYLATYISGDIGFK